MKSVSSWCHKKYFFHPLIGLCSDPTQHTRSSLPQSSNCSFPFLLPSPSSNAPHHRLQRILLARHVKSHWPLPFAVASIMCEWSASRAGSGLCPAPWHQRSACLRLMRKSEAALSVPFHLADTAPASLCVCACVCVLTRPAKEIKMGRDGNGDNIISNALDGEKCIFFLFWSDVLFFKLKSNFHLLLPVKEITRRRKCTVALPRHISAWPQRA